MHRPPGPSPRDVRHCQPCRAQRHAASHGDARHAPDRSGSDPSSLRTATPCCGSTRRSPSESLSLRFHGASNGIADRAARVVLRPGPRASRRARGGAGGARRRPGRPSWATSALSHPAPTRWRWPWRSQMPGNGTGSGGACSSPRWRGRSVTGSSRLRASMLSTNVAILGLVRSMGRAVTLTMPGAGVMEATIDLPERHTSRGLTEPAIGLERASGRCRAARRMVTNGPCPGPRSPRRSGQRRAR